MYVIAINKKRGHDSERARWNIWEGLGGGKRGGKCCN